MDADFERGDSVADPPRSLRLDSWKEIAAYLKRDVATVRRWEKREGLPVHRQLHERLGSVFAHTAELDAWAEGRRQQPSAAGVTNGGAASPGDEIFDARLTSFPWWLRALPWGLAGTFALAFGAVLVLWPPWRHTAAPAAQYLPLSPELGDEVRLSASRVQFGDVVAITPDGSTMAFVAQSAAGQPQLYIRRLNPMESEPLSGTEEAQSPFFSPDGSRLGFFADGKLKAIALNGGAPITLADAPGSRGGTWSGNDSIIFCPGQAAGTRLHRVSITGDKAAEPLTTLADGELIQLWPQELPGGRAVLFTSSGVVGSYNNADIVVQELPSGERKVVHKGGFHARYLSSGHLTFIHDGKLFAAGFDLDRLEMTGPLVVVIKNVSSNASTAGAQFAVSNTGSLVYLEGAMIGVDMPIHWMDREGKTSPLRPTPANWIFPRFSPDGTQLALEVRDASSHIWVYDWARDTLRRLTDGTPADQRPVWAPDSQRMAFASPSRDTTATNLYWQRADRTGGARRLTTSKNPQRPSSFHPSGRYLAFEENTPATKVDVMILRLEGSDEAGWTAGTSTAFVRGPYPEFDPMFSPDGQWIAYTSVESGHPEVFVRPFPGPGGHWLIGAGANPTWSSAREIFYGIEDGRIMVVPYTVDGQSFRPGKARPVASTQYEWRGPQRMFDLHPDGTRFALAVASAKVDGRTPDKVRFVINFFDELRQKATVASSQR